jgi:hypothetical protein
MKTKKIAFWLFLALFLHLQAQAQFLSYISTPKKNVAYFEKIAIYENLKCTGRIDQRIFMYELNNSLYINDYSFTILDKKEYNYEDSLGGVVVYTCYDKLKKEYDVTIYYSKGMSYVGCVIEKNTNMRFGLALEITKGELKD